MKIIIMCGGKGRRLGKLTKMTPKPLIKVTNKTILELKINHYIQKGFKEFILCIGYKGELIRKTVSKFDSNIKFEFSDAGVEAGILCRLYTARHLFDKQVIMTYGDTFADLDLNQFINTHRNSDNEATIVVAPIENPFGLVEFNEVNKVTYFHEKPVLDYYIGYAIINKSAFNLIPESIVRMPDGQGLVIFFKILAAMNKLGVYYNSGLQVTFNTPEELEEAKDTIIRFYSNREA
jgi:glucose-1-phosphate cytidylyltransferase